MTEQKKRDWSTRVGTVKPDSLETFKTKNDVDALRATVVNAEGKETIVEAFSEKAQKLLKDAAGSDKPMVFRGPAYFTDGKVPHLMVGTVAPQAEPKPAAEKRTPEELEAAKQARAEANRARAAERDASRVLVEAGTVEVGNSVEKDGKTHEVLFVGAAFEKDGKTSAYAYFGELGAEMAAKAAEKTADEAAPSM